MGIRDRCIRYSMKNKGRFFNTIQVLVDGVDAKELQEYRVRASLKMIDAELIL